MKKEIYLIIVVVVLIAALSGLFIWMRRKKLAAQNTSPEAPVNPTGTTYIPESFPLKIYMKGEKIRAMQSKIGTEPDSYFGVKTEAALIAKGHPTIVDETTYAKIIGIAETTVEETLYDDLKKFLGLGFSDYANCCNYL